MNTLKGLIAAVLLLAGLAVASPALAQIEPPAKPFDVTLRVATFPGTWTEAIRKEIGAALTKAGITLEFVGGNSSEFLAKLVTARGRSVPFDVIEIGDDTYPDFRSGDFLEKIDHSKIPNLSKVDSSLYDEYIVSNWLSEPGVVYNADKFKEAGIPAPKRFSDLANPALKGRVLFPDITSYNVYYLITALARENGGSEADPAAGFEMIKKIAPHSAVSKSGTVAQLFQTGEVWAAIWGAHIGQRIAQSGINISVVHPPVKDGKVAIARGFLGIAKGSPNKAAAEYYINAILTKGVQAQFSTEYGMVPVTTEARATARSDSGKDKSGVPFLKLDDDDVAKAWWPDYNVIDKRDWARRFQRAITN
jgi:putative spermidine/putrescine transport system substrate-binding protein